jgi:predicted Zn-dependent protease
MRLQKSAAATARSPVPTDPNPPAARRRRRILVLGAVVPLAALAGWWAWSVWGPDPLGAVHAALDSRDFRAADELLSKRLAEHPDDRAAQVLAARAARRGGDLARAFTLLQQYREKNGSDEASDLEFALLRAQGGNPAEADQLFARYADRPEAADAALAMEAYLEGKLKVLAPRTDARPDAAAIESAGVANLNRAVELWLHRRPGRADQVQGRIWRARVLIFAGDSPAGAAALREALGLMPDHFDARFQLALALAQQSPDEARHHLEILRARYPENHYVRFGLATTYRMLGRSNESRQLLETLLTGPTELSALVELAALDLDGGKVDEARRRLQTALDRAPDSPDVNRVMSRCEQLAGHPAEAAKYRQRFDEIEAARKKSTAPKP